MLHHADKQIRQWIIFLRIEREMLTMFETAAGEQHWQVSRDVPAGVSEIAAHQDLGVIE